MSIGQTVVILTNAPAIPAQWTAANGEQGSTIVAGTFGQCLRLVRKADVLLIDGDPPLLLKLCALFIALPWLGRPLLSVDLVLRAPQGWLQRLTLPVKRFLLARVDRFLLYFRDLSGYTKYFGIAPARSEYVPFKPNLRYHSNRDPSPDGDYVLCFGRSMRDFDTFFDAVERLPYPAAIAQPDFEALRSNGSRFTRTLSELPKQVRLLEHDPGDYRSQAEVLMGARVVVVPLLKSCLVQSGTPLNAMLMGKCVILTEGPATNGLFNGEVLPVPPEDSEALAKAIDRAWNDKELRETTAAKGFRYAFDLGGEPELTKRLVDSVVAWMGS